MLETHIKLTMDLVIHILMITGECEELDLGRYHSGFARIATYIYVTCELDVSKSPRCLVVLFILCSAFTTS